MAGTKVVVYGLSTEGYSVACQMAIKGADVHLVDELAPSAISLKAEIAKTYPNVSSLKEDEPLLSMEPIDVAISKAQYLFFTPKIRKTGQDIKTEIHSKFKDAASPLKKNSSVVYCLPTGFNGNNENISLLEHVTGFEAGKTISYFYYPLSQTGNPDVLGSFNSKIDKKLADLLSVGKKLPSFVPLHSSEHMYAIDMISRFTHRCSIMEVCRLAHDEQTGAEPPSEFEDLFLDDMVEGLYDLRSLGSSLEGATTLMYLINGSKKGIDGYIKRLIDEIRSTLKRNELKASRTRVAISWTLDQHEMRGDRIETLDSLTLRLRDYVADVEAYEDPDFDLFHSEKTTIVVACSKADYDSVGRGKKSNDLILIKANPTYETSN